jgi:hypothetical protein
MKAASVASLEDLELELRLLPGVVHVGFSSVDEDRSIGVVVVALVAEPDLLATAERLARAYRTAATVEIITIGEPIQEAGEPSFARERVRLVTARYDPTASSCEVTLALSEQSGVGHASDGPLIGTAAATLEALSALGLALPVRLVSVSTKSGVDNSPVRVILGDGGDDAWVGIAQGRSESESASRATLDAFNRFTGHKRAAPVQ